jgi:hypothetical protein
MAKRDYKVGYKRPPVETRFKPGHSGNPAGRPKGRRNLQTAIRQYLDAEIQVSIGQRKQTMSRLDALVHRVFNAAIAGDIKAFQHALSLAKLYDAEGPGELVSDPQSEAEQLQLIRQLLMRQRAKAEEPSGDE